MYNIRGKVRVGKKRGRQLGYPTANIALRKKFPQGIYISETLFEGRALPSVSFVGNAETFGEEEIKLETHILDFDQNIYNQTISVRLLKKIRGNEKFETAEKLVSQIAKDVKIAKEHFRVQNSNIEIRNKLNK
jgi:riboflavin kinase/FMN adenylyltransferase